jgi:hypothetical protein
MSRLQKLEELVLEDNDIRHTYCTYVVDNTEIVLHE